ncbi:MAG: hypothetical protein OXC30_03980 [Alphaproteobacteria bacterium]|nr:hypothetical protein [Alphaproteobacteria bacterium]
MKLKLLPFLGLAMIAGLAACNKAGMRNKKSEMFTLENCVEECATLGMEADVVASKAGSRCRCKSVSSGVA